MFLLDSLQIRWLKNLMMTYSVMMTQSWDYIDSDIAKIFISEIDRNIYTLTILVLTTILILELLLMLDLWLGIIDLNNTNNMNENRWRINACNIASSKSVELVYVLRSKNKCIIIFDWGKLAAAFYSLNLIIKLGWCQ